MSLSNPHNNKDFPLETKPNPPQDLAILIKFVPDSRYHLTKFDKIILAFYLVIFVLLVPERVQEAIDYYKIVGSDYEGLLTVALWGLNVLVCIALLTLTYKLFKQPSVKFTRPSLHSDVPPGKE
jgi:hypothetical protein